MSDQRAESFAEPSRDEIVAFSAQHVAALEASDRDPLWVLAGMHHLVLRTTGRRSGRDHKVALPYWRDPQGRAVVVASFAGATHHPAWYLNMVADPGVQVVEQGDRYPARAVDLDGAEYDATWAALTADRPHYLDYQTRTERRIPLVRLDRYQT